MRTQDQQQRWVIGVAAVCFAAIVVGIYLGGGGETGRKTPRMHRPTDLEVLEVAKVMGFYEANEIKADATMKGRRFAVRGRVQTVGKDILDEPYVTLAGEHGSILAVQCYFAPDQQERLGDLRRGDWITVAGTGDGKMMNVLLRDCWIYPGK